MAAASMARLLAASSWVPDFRNTAKIAHVGPPTLYYLCLTVTLWQLKGTGTLKAAKQVSTKIIQNVLFRKTCKR